MRILSQDRTRTRDTPGKPPTRWYMIYKVRSRFGSTETTFGTMAAAERQVLLNFWTICNKTIINLCLPSGNCESAMDESYNRYARRFLQTNLPYPRIDIYAVLIVTYERILKLTKTIKTDKIIYSALYLLSKTLFHIYFPKLYRAEKSRAPKGMLKTK